MKKSELFFKTHAPQVREVVHKREDGTEVTVPHFEGYAIVFDSPSVNMWECYKDGSEYREYIDKGAVTQQTLDSGDCVCTAFHNREKLLARHHADGTGTMTMTVDEVGVKVEFDFDPANPCHNEVLSAVKRGDMTGMSFTFWFSDVDYTDSYTSNADGVESVTRHITSIRSIPEVTVASSPAYPATTAEARETIDGIFAAARDKYQADAKAKADAATALAVALKERECEREAMERDCEMPGTI